MAARCGLGVRAPPPSPLSSTWRCQRSHRGQRALRLRSIQTSRISPAATSISIGSAGSQPATSPRLTVHTPARPRRASRGSAAPSPLGAPGPSSFNAGCGRAAASWRRPVAAPRSPARSAADLGRTERHGEAAQRRWAASQWADSRRVSRQGLPPRGRIHELHVPAAGDARDPLHQDLCVPLRVADLDRVHDEFHRAKASNSGIAAPRDPFYLAARPPTPPHVVAEPTRTASRTGSGGARAGTRARRARRTRRRRPGRRAASPTRSGAAGPPEGSR